MIIKKLTTAIKEHEDLQEVFLRAAFLFEKWFYRDSLKDYPELGVTKGWTPDVLEADLTQKDINQLKSCLIEFVPQNLENENSSTAVWALGKLHDPRLLPFFRRVLAAALKKRYDSLLYQAIVALDLLGESLLPRGMPSTNVPEHLENRRLARSYLRSLPSGDSEELDSQEE